MNKQIKQNVSPSIWRSLHSRLHRDNFRLSLLFYGGMLFALWLIGSLTILLSR